jgi:hypothetical protein
MYTGHLVLSGYQVKEDEMGGACSKHVKCDKCIHFALLRIPEL